MSQKKSAPPLDPIHWDYRTITADEFQVAALYEYARCCPRVVAQWEKWLSSDIPTVIRVDWGPPILDPGRRVKVAEMLQMFPEGLPLDETPDSEADLLISSFPIILRRAGLAPLLLRAPQFPRPWLKLGPERQKRLLRSVPVGLPRTRGFRDYLKMPFGIKTGFKAAIAGKRRAGPFPDADVSFRVVVDFSQKLEVIEADFAKWLRSKRIALRQAGVVPSELKNAGRGMEIDYDALTCLACYNFRAAGVPYEAARKATKDQNHEVPVNHACVVLPLYEQDSNWSDGVRRAKNLMSRLFGARRCSVEYVSSPVQLRKGCS